MVAPLRLRFGELAEVCDGLRCRSRGSRASRRLGSSPSCGRLISYGLPPARVAEARPPRRRPSAAWSGPPLRVVSHCGSRRAVWTRQGRGSAEQTRLLLTSQVLVAGRGWRAAGGRLLPCRRTGRPDRPTYRHWSSCRSTFRSRRRYERPRPGWRGGGYAVDVVDGADHSGQVIRVSHRLLLPAERSVRAAIRRTHAHTARTVVPSRASRESTRRRYGVAMKW